MKYLIRITRLYYDGSSGPRISGTLGRARIIYAGMHGSDTCAPLVPFEDRSSAYAQIMEWMSFDYHLDHGEYSRPTYLVVPVKCADKWTREQVL